ncbi:MAG: hypothetical protein ACPHAS_06875 [Synechococcus sp.]
MAWPLDLPAQRLRPWLIERLQEHGQPLRWAITAVESDVDGCKQLLLEAVVQ